MTDDPSLKAAYALETPQDNQRLYANWADSYDQSFAQAMDYQMPQIIAQIYAEAPQEPVLDIGAGTGLVGQHMPQGVALDGLDISAQMLEVARARGVYRDLLECDLSQKLPLADATYGALISAGTFTHGHVGPDALDGLLRVAKQGARFVIGINAAHFEARGFAAKFDALGPQIDGLELRDVDIYGDAADAEHRGDQARVAVFLKR